MNNRINVQIFHAEKKLMGIPILSVLNFGFHGVGFNCGTHHKETIFEKKELYSTTYIIHPELSAIEYLFN